MSIVQFFNEANAMRTILSNTAALAAEKGKEMAEALIQQSKIKLKIQVLNPLIIVPQNSNSDNVVIIDLGKFVIHNDISDVSFFLFFFKNELNL